jgi:hypothetical protein
MLIHRLLNTSPVTPEGEKRRSGMYGGNISQYVECRLNARIIVQGGGCAVAQMYRDLEARCWIRSSVGLPMHEGCNTRTPEDARLVCRGWPVYKPSLSRCCRFVPRKFGSSFVVQPRSALPVAVALLPGLANEEICHSTCD